MANTPVDIGGITNVDLGGSFNTSYRPKQDR